MVIGTDCIGSDNFDYSLEQALNFTENIIITGDLNVPNEKMEGW
jgi:hypothetical protein